MKHPPGTTRQPGDKEGFEEPFRSPPGSVSRSPSDHTFRWLVPALLLAALLTGAPFPEPLLAQTATTGAISGLITGEDGAPLDGVEVILRREGERTERTLTASREGRFSWNYLTPGEYTLVLERFGFIPVHVSGVTVRSGRQLLLEPQLRESPPPVTETDRFTFEEVGVERSLGGGRSASRSRLRNLPVPGYELTEVLRLSSRASTADGTFGLPDHLTGVVVDGQRFEATAHPRLGPGFLHLTTLSPFFLQEAEFAAQNLNVATGGRPSGSLQATTIRGGNEFEVEGFGTMLGRPLNRDGGLGESMDPEFRPGGGLLVRGPILTDTAHFAVGIQARQAHRPVEPLAGSSSLLRSEFLDRMSDPELGEAQRLVPTRLDRWDALTTFGRLDWRLGTNHTVTLTSLVSTVQSGSEEQSPGVPLAPPQAFDASDVLVTGGTFSVLGERSAMELQVGFHRSTREYRSATTGSGKLNPGANWILDGGLTAGVDAGIPGRFQSTSLRVAPVMYLSARSHELKLGIDLAGRTYTETFSSGPLFWSAYPTLTAFDANRGSGIRAERPGREVDFSRSTLGVFVQDRWTPSEDLVITVGLRADREALPFSNILPNEQWASRTGIVRTRDDVNRGRFSPRVQFEWTPDPNRKWQVESSAGVHYGEVHPGILAEVLADSGEVRIHRTLGAIRESGEPSQTSDARRLSLIGPRFDSPRTQAVDVGVSRVLTPSTSAAVSLGYRQTDFLPRRRDLNRIAASFGVDQFGRALYGEVVQDDGVVSVRPGSDRRFNDFDVVSALESDGWSTWWGLTLGVTAGDGNPLEMAASYTFSRTEDNVPGGSEGWPVTVMGSPGVESSRPAWVEGRSDLDVPHRATVSGTLRLLDQPGIRIGALYNIHSGRPFTPTVRDLLHTRDMLSGGTGLASVAGPPISVPSGIDGLGAITSRWPCLNELTTGSRDRNTCRTDTVHDFSIRFGVDLRSGAGWRLSLDVDALNLLDHGLVIPDPAVFVVDGSGQLSPVADGRLNLPVKVNPDFGEPLVRLSPGRSLRIGLGLRY